MIDRKKAAAGLAAGFAVITAGGIGLATRAHAAPPAMRPAMRPRMERHPEIEDALRHLQMAATSLRAARHDFRGHRAAALSATERAIAECQSALASDRH